MRSDNAARHMKTHEKSDTSINEAEIRNGIRRRKKVQEKAHERRELVKKIATEEMFSFEYDDFDEYVIKDELLADEEAYKKLIKRGHVVCSTIEEGTVREDSLSRVNREALHVYRKQIPRRDLTDANLRPWQEKLMKELIPTDREILWIMGKDGNEGKTWFQKYLEGFYGYSRVVRLDLEIKTANVWHALTKRPLTSIDIFLFNLPRSANLDVCNYSVLEQIKDGTATTSKYNNDIIRFKTPNILIVFSNYMPEWDKLSDDRWKPFRIENNELIVRE